MSRVHFVNYRQLFADLEQWQQSLPHFDAFVGVPRSGVMIAAWLQARRNSRLVDIQMLEKYGRQAIDEAIVRNNNPLSRRPHGHKVLVVDDTANTMLTTGMWRDRLRATNVELFFGTVYISDKTVGLDFWHREISRPRCFEWQWYRSTILESAWLDFDGVLCVDPPRQEEDSDPTFPTWLATVKPCFLPTRKVRGIATSRLEKYRNISVEWLNRHGVSYHELRMHPSASAEARRRLGDHASRKASIFAADRDAVLFVESSEKQARVISNLTGKSVLCADTMTML